MKIRKGIIEGFDGSWNSGIGHLRIKDSETKQIECVPCENPTTVRSLEHAYGNVISAGHTALIENIKGKEIFWVYDEFGLLLGGFLPVEEDNGELEEKYLEQKIS